MSKSETTISMAGPRLASLAIAFRYLTARAVIAAGIIIRPWLDDEFAHAAMLRVIRFGWWRPGDR